MTSRSNMLLRFAFALLAVAASLSMAQVVPSSSIDPLNGSTFSTPFFSVSPTYTITSTFPSAGSTTPTAVSGTAGPSPATGSYVYSYAAPVSSLSGVVPSSLFSSLAANGLPTVYTAAFQPNQEGLQIVDAATVPTAPLASIAAMTLTCILAAVWIL